MEKAYGPLQDAQNGRWYFAEWDRAGVLSRIDPCSRCGGHDRPDGATKHFRDTLHERNSFPHTSIYFLSSTVSDIQMRCEVCGEWTASSFSLPLGNWYRRWWICSVCNSDGAIRPLINHWIDFLLDIACLIPLPKDYYDEGRKELLCP